MKSKILLFLMFAMSLVHGGCYKKEIKSLQKQLEKNNEEIEGNRAKSTTFSITFGPKTAFQYKSLFDIKPDKDDVLLIFLKNELFSYAMLPQMISDSLTLRYSIEEVGVSISLYKGDELAYLPQTQTLTFKAVSIPIHD